MPVEFAFCPDCGARLQRVAIARRLRPFCAACRYIQFLNPAVGVAAIIRDGAGRVLLCRKTRGGIWSFPSGYLEWDEEIREGLAREVREELGLAIEVGDVFAVHSNVHNRDKQTVGVFFRAVVSGGDLTLAEGEIDDAGYFALAAFPPLTYPTDELVAGQLRLEG
jgi:ADP-ribose pyrophosphatase YjhB (NUDIX family)